MNTWAILPLRSLRDGKRRLRGTLSAFERTTLVQQLFAHTLGAIQASQVVRGVAVVSPDPDLLAWIERFDVVPIMQPDLGLNAGLEHARRDLLAHFAPDALLVVLPDLPLIARDDLIAMVRRSTPRSVVLAPDQHGTGTNALLVRPAEAIPFRFGAGSFDHHRHNARSHRLAVHRYDALGTALDVDVPDDLAVMHERVAGIARSFDHAPGLAVSACLCGE